MRIIKYLPGDFVELDNGNDILILSIDSLGISYFGAPHGEPLVKVGGLWYVRGYSVDGHPNKIHHLFDFNLYNSVICSTENFCFPRQIAGECSGCPLGTVFGEAKTLYLPGDEVYLIAEKEVQKINHISLALSNFPGGYHIFKPGIPEAGQVNLFWDILGNYIPEKLTLFDAWELIKENYISPKIRYYLKDSDLSGRWGENIRLRDRGNCQYLKDTDLDVLCGICIYQDSQECSKCNVNKLKNLLHT